jgi:hypothetical protein
MKNYEDIFENCLDGVTIEDNGRLIIHNKSNHPIEVRGKVNIHPVYISFVYKLKKIH